MADKQARVAGSGTSSTLVFLSGPSRRVPSKEPLIGRVVAIPVAADLVLRTCTLRKEWRR